MKNGTVKKVVTEKGFGFIETDGDDVFFHVSALDDKEAFETLEKGTRVQYESEISDKGPRATRIVILG